MEVMVSHLVKSARIVRLKARARSQYLSYFYELDKMDCGIHMAEMMNPRVAQCKAAFNQTMDELAKLDPNCPTKRL